MPPEVWVGVLGFDWFIIPQCCSLSGLAIISPRPTPPPLKNPLRVPFIEAFQGVWATSDIASKCGDNLLPKYRQPTEVDTKEATICENDNFLRWSGDKGTQKDATRRQDYPPWKASLFGNRLSSAETPRQLATHAISFASLSKFFAALFYKMLFLLGERGSNPRKLIRFPRTLTFFLRKVIYMPRVTQPVLVLLSYDWLK